MLRSTISTATLTVVAAFALALSGCAGTSAKNLMTDPVFTPDTAQTYAVDAVHSSIVFKIQHAGTADFFGNFQKMSGTLKFAPKDLENSSVRVVIDTASVDTNNGDRDGHVKALFETDKYPEAIFEGANFRHRGGNRYTIDGTMTFHGVTQEMSVDAVLVGSSNMERFGPKVGFTSSFILDRTAFGVAPDMPASVLGTDVQVMIGVEANLQR